MGRELKRVPLNFKWTKDKVWDGYVNPFYKQAIKCTACNGSGESSFAKRLSDLWYGYTPFFPEDRGSIPFNSNNESIMNLARRNCRNDNGYSIQLEAERLCDLFNGSWSHHCNQEDINALIEDGRLIDFTHTWKQGEGWKKKDPEYIPTVKEVNDWSISGLGHDSINSWVVIKAEAKRLGVDPYCYECSGEGRKWPSQEIKKSYEEWEPTEPPKGDGYQLWETVSEGSPVSPVFDSAEELADWLANCYDYRFRKNDAGNTFETWMSFIEGPEWSPSMVSIDGKFINGVKVQEILNG